MQQLSGAIAYCYVPSGEKPADKLDAKPCLWPSFGPNAHPPLAEAPRSTIAAQGWATLREHKRCAAAEREEAEPRFRDSDIWPVVVAQNIQADIAGRDRLMAYAKRCGGPAMLDYMFSYYQLLPDLITRAWQTEHAEECVKQFDKTRIQILAEAATGDCVCAGRWKAAARELLAANDISHVQWAEAESRLSSRVCSMVARRGSS